MRERKIRAAIEEVFRRTHGREMTPAERRMFGLPEKSEDSSQENEKSLPPEQNSRNHNNKRKA
jgi:hypothetical protein